MLIYIKKIPKRGIFFKYLFDIIKERIYLQKKEVDINEK